MNRSLIQPGTGFPLTRAQLIDLIQQDEWWTVDSFNAWTTVTAGTGATSRLQRRGRVATGATAGSTALLRIIDQTGWSIGKDFKVLDWDKKIVIDFFATMADATTSGVCRFKFGEPGGSGLGALTDKGIGFRWDNTALVGIVHNGSDGADVSTLAIILEDITNRYTITSDGMGNIEWFVGGVSGGKSSAGPTGDSTSDATSLMFEAENNADSAAQGLTLHNLKVFVSQ